MQSMDRNHRVIYINTFSKTMVPSLRIGYMVLPEKLMERYISTMNFYSCTVSGFEQYAMAAFLEKGYFERHIRRLLNDYRGQRERICRCFGSHLKSGSARSIRMTPGLTFCCMRTELSDVRESSGQPRQRGILVNCLFEYCAADAQKYREFLVYYSDMDEILQKVIGALEEIFCALFRAMKNCVLRMLAFRQISSFIWRSNHHEQITCKHVIQESYEVAVLRMGF